MKKLFIILLLAFTSSTLVLAHSSGNDGHGCHKPTKSDKHHWLGTNALG